MSPPPKAPKPSEAEYQPQDALKPAFKNAMIFGGGGLFASAIVNSMAKTNVGALGVITRSGGMITQFAAVGGVYGFAEAASANMRQKKDHYNHAIAGFLSGSVIGMQTRRMPVILGCGAFVSIVMAAFDFTGGTLRGLKPDDGLEEWERKELLRKNRRRPIEETIAELGEGKAGAIHPPGYEERRRQRLKEAYGFEVKTVSADPNAA